MMTGAGALASAFIPDFTGYLARGMDVLKLV
jgi:hypothetical protein